MITVDIFRLVAFCVGALMVIIGALLATLAKSENEHAGCLQFLLIGAGAVVMVSAVPW
jgi:hypothetical protein